ncbi:hypothetical protein, partial [Streptomyces brasiliscabiei]|uniref:hypothetical protein n=1 Tax=Streptomyces brasiliscabiei TaxID=2736302 RepID=UPI00301497E6
LDQTPTWPSALPYQNPYFDSSNPEIDTTPSRIKNKVLMYQKRLIDVRFSGAQPLQAAPCSG